MSDGVKTGLICFGSSYESTREARDRFHAAGLKTNLLLLRALPLTAEVKQFLEAQDVVYFVEQNRDAQMAAIFKEDWPALSAKIVSILVYDGLPLAAGEIVRQIEKHRETLKAKKESWQERRQIASV